MGDILSFTFERQRIPFRVDGRTFTLRELDTGERGVWMNELQTRTKIGSDGKPKSVDSKGLQGALLALCVLDETGKTVPASDLETWPARVVNTLFHKAQEISGLDQEAEKAAKNG